MKEQQENAHRDLALDPPISRTAGWLLIWLTILAYVAACFLVSRVLFDDPIGRSLGRLYNVTGFLVQSTLVGGMVSLALTGIVIFGVGRFRVTDVGWHYRSAATGICLTLAIWIGMQVIVALVATVNGSLAWNAEWTRFGGRLVIGGVLGQLLGNALVEETVCRGFLLPQFYLHARQRMQHPRALAVAVIGSSTVYSLTHIPNLVFIKSVEGVELMGYLAGLVALGVILAAVYLVTCNLFIAIGIHAVLNTPAPLAHASDATLAGVWFGLTIGLLFAWPRITNFRKHISKRI